MTVSNSGRLLALESFDAATNMAIDDAILQSVSERRSGPTLRFYGWSRPTLSLGYFQKATDGSDWARTAAGGKVMSDTTVDRVRRCTGGGAILHHHELTYSLTLPLDDATPGARRHVYQSVHRSVIESLHRLGVAAFPFSESPQSPESHQYQNSQASDLETAVVATPTAGLRTKKDEPFLCFQRRTEEDLICGGYKILGSAQRRIRGAVLQHGSLLLQASPFADVLPGVLELSGVDIDAKLMSQTVAERIGHALSLSWSRGELKDDEFTSSTRIALERYAADEWTRRR